MTELCFSPFWKTRGCGCKEMLKQRKETGLHSKHSVLKWKLIAKEQEGVSGSKDDPGRTDTIRF